MHAEIVPVTPHCGSTRIDGVRSTLQPVAARHTEDHAGSQSPPVRVHAPPTGLAKPLFEAGTRFAGLLSSLVPNNIFNSCRSILRIIMFPNPQDDPTGVGKPAVSVRITSPVGGHLFSPVGRIRHCNRVVLRAPVPETAVQKNRDSFSRKDQVGRPSQALDGCSRDAIPQAQRVDCGAQGDLGFRVSAPVRPHAGTNAGRRGP